MFYVFYLQINVFNIYNLTDPTCICRLHWGEPVWVLPRFWASENLCPGVTVWRCLHDPVFSRFSRTPTCDRRTDTTTARVARVKTTRSNFTKLSVRVSCGHGAILLWRLPLLWMTMTYFPIIGKAKTMPIGRINSFKVTHYGKHWRCWCLWLLC